MFDFFLVHWVLFALVFTIVCILMIVVSVLLERKRIARLQARKTVALENACIATEIVRSTNENVTRL